MFSQIFGHEPIKQRLEFAFQNDHIPSGYLFIGPSGIGKSTLTKEFAQMMNCRTKDICHQCENCRMFDNGSHPDFHLIKPSGQDIRIAQIHQLIDQLSFKPAYAKKRVVLVKNAHRLNQESANSFLKILEEPPLDTLIILMTHDENLLLETILSRCQKILFSPLTRLQLKNAITDKYNVNSDELEFILNYAGGRIRKDFINNVSTLFNMRNQVLKILQNLRTENMIDHCLLLEKWTKKELHGFFLEFCSAWIRDFICLKSRVEEGLINLDMINELRSRPINYTEEQLQWSFDLVIETELAIQVHAAKILALESLLVQLKQVFGGVLVI